MKADKLCIIQDRTLIILWLSRHDIQADQLRELRACFGDNIKVIQIRKTHENAQKITNLAESYKADEIVAVLPLNLMGALTRTRYKPIRPVMKAGPGDTWTHDHFERVLSVDTVSQVIVPLSAHRRAATGPAAQKRDHVGGVYPANERNANLGGYDMGVEFSQELSNLINARYPVIMKQHDAAIRNATLDEIKAIIKTSHGFAEKQCIERVVQDARDYYDIRASTLEYVLDKIETLRKGQP